MRLSLPRAVWESDEVMLLSHWRRRTYARRTLLFALFAGALTTTLLVVLVRGAHDSSPPASAAITARDGFGNPVEWFFIIKLPQQTFDPAQVDELSHLGYSARDVLHLTTEHCTCPDPTCTSSAAGASVGEGRGSGLCYLYADSSAPTLRYFANVSDPNGSGVHLDCLGQGGNDPLTHTLRQLHVNYDAADVEWAFWNDQYEKTADAHYADVCAYSGYSHESLPYTDCLSDADCGQRCKKSDSDYRVCASDDDCEDGDSCAQVQQRGRTRGLPFASACAPPTMTARRVRDSPICADPMPLAGSASLLFGLWGSRRAQQGRPGLPAQPERISSASNDAQLPRPLAKGKRGRACSAWLPAERRDGLSPIIPGAHLVSQ